MIGDTIRETEASRLKTRGSIKTRCSDLRQLEDQPNWTGMQQLRERTQAFACTAQQAQSKHQQADTDFHPGLHLQRAEPSLHCEAHTLSCN